MKQIKKTKATKPVITEQQKLELFEEFAKSLMPKIRKEIKAAIRESKKVNIEISSEGVQSYLQRSNVLDWYFDKNLPQA